VVITPAQVYDKVVLLTEQVTRLLERDQATREKEADRDTTLAQLETRVRNVEARVWLAAGVCAGAGSGIVTALTQVLR
jgi:hypothetical protein